MQRTLHLGTGNSEVCKESIVESYTSILSVGKETLVSSVLTRPHKNKSLLHRRNFMGMN